MNKHNYGYYFNSIEIKDDVVIKTAKNLYGKNKIENEINFYNYIIANNVEFPMPKLIFDNVTKNTKIDMSLLIFEKNCSDSVRTPELRSSVDLRGLSGDCLPSKDNNKNSTFQIEFLDKHKTLCDVLLYKYAKNINNSEFIKIIKIILNHMNKLHLYKRIYVNKNEYISQLNMETMHKIVNRYNETDWKMLPYFLEITHVNGVKIHDIHYYIKKINTRIEKIIYNLNEYYFTLIHGDVHLGNIMINDNDDIRFIDPRGYFGNMKLYGIHEYDFAKLIFGLSGYSTFDKIEICNISIINGNIDIPFINKYTAIYESNLFTDYSKLLSLTIWLSNNSMYLDFSKKIYSLMISYYLCENYLCLYN